MKKVVQGAKKLFFRLVSGGCLPGLLLAVILIVPTVCQPAHAARYAAIVVESETGRILHARNPDKPVYPASLTKMMTLYLVFEALAQGRLSLDQKFKVSRQASRQPASRLGLKPGSHLSVREAILALVTKSANDVATVVGEALGNGSEKAFARMMTRKAKTLGMRRTQFRNASGIHDPRQQSTARDMSILARALLRDFPQYYSYFSTTKFRHGGRSYGNHNKLLKSYKGMDGIKTGYIRASGYNLAASAEREGDRLVAVVIGGKTSKKRNRQVARLLDKSFATLKARKARVQKVRPSKTNLARVNPSTSQTHPPVVRPQPRAQAIPSASGDPHYWSVQLGAFKKYTQALRLAHKVVDQLSNEADRARIHVLRLDQSTQSLYRSRLTGYNERQARAVCRKIKALGMECLLVVPDKKRRKLASAVP